jgi:hypothetical protein
MRFSSHPVEIIASRKNLAWQYYIVAHVEATFLATLMPDRLGPSIYTILIGILPGKDILRNFR